MIKKKDSNAKGSNDREQPTSKKLREIMICGRSDRKCHVDDFTPNRKMGEKKEDDTRMTSSPATQTNSEQ